MKANYDDKEEEDEEMENLQRLLDAQIQSLLHMKCSRPPLRSLLLNAGHSSLDVGERRLRRAVHRLHRDVERLKPLCQYELLLVWFHESRCLYLLMYLAVLSHMGFPLEIKPSCEPSALENLGDLLRLRVPGFEAMQRFLSRVSATLPMRAITQVDAYS